MAKKLGFILSGCGNQDGTEIHEAVIALLALEREGFELNCFAPDKPQTVVKNFITGQPLPNDTRNVLVESARIARGKVRPLGEARAEELDGVVLPGGFGAALNLCDFALKGTQMTVEPDLVALLRDIHAARKPIGAICIAPVILAKVFAELRPKLTLGSDPEDAQKIEALGAQHVTCGPGECVIDEANFLVTTPAYMFDATPKEIAPGIEALARAMSRMSKA
jgi:enhancing lycopene biosynthesis protein 2